MDVSKLTKIIGKENIIPLQDQVYKAKVFWIKLDTKSGMVEGKLYIPNKASEKIILFEPGFPGGGSTQFEQLWLSKILQNGNNVFLARHNGTLLNGKFSANYINCKERQNLGKSNNETVINNNKNNTITNWLNEPLVALKVLTPYFKEIVLCGHSFGPLALIHSLIIYKKEEPILCKRIKRIVSLSGSLGIFRSEDHPFLKVWFDHLNTEWARERVEIGDAKINTDIFYKAHVEINNNARLILKDVDFIAVVPWGDTNISTDEIVHPIESLEFITSLGRGYLIIDKKEYGDKKSGRMAHDMEALSAEDLLNFVSSSWKPESQITVLK